MGMERGIFIEAEPLLGQVSFRKIQGRNELPYKATSFTCYVGYC